MFLEILFLDILDICYRDTYCCFQLTPFKSTNFVGSRSEFNLLNELKKGKQDQNLEYILRLFNDGVDVNCRDADGRTPLHLSLYNEDVFNYLINNRSVQIDAQSNDGCTPLMDACKTNEQVVIDELISRGAKVNATNNDGSTPLHFAAAHDNDVGCIILLRNSAKVDAQDNKVRKKINYLIPVLSSYRKQSINFQCRSIDWLLYDENIDCN